MAASKSNANIPDNTSIPMPLYLSSFDVQVLEELGITGIRYLYDNPVAQQTIVQLALAIASSQRQDLVEEVIQELKTLRSKNEKAKELKEQTINYFTEHAERMMYKTYTDQGYLIGSGPIEAAHRSVLQQRMKLSGQKWTTQGANAIANLRCYRKSGAWGIIKNIIRAA